LNYIIVITLSFALSACSLFSPKKAPEVVASCFSDGEDQTKMCKSQRTDDESKIVITRCIGTQNREANPALRGKCVEKICSEGSNTDCQVKGEIRVLAQYADLVTSNMFGEGESAAVTSPPPPSAKKKMSAREHRKAKAEIDTDPSAVLPPMPEKKVEVAATPKPTPPKFTEEEAASPQMAIELKPAKATKKNLAGRSPRMTASLSKGDGGFKKVCVAKNDSEAPEILRGKCATRSCLANGKCSYKGRKEMFDYAAARNEAG